MLYFRNTELAKLYDISEKTVRNWIKQAQGGKLEFDLYTADNGKTYLADTTRNTLAVEALIANNKKYVNGRTHKAVWATDEFDKTFSRKQKYDIISHLEKFNEFPFHYAHVGRSAEVCAQYYDRLFVEPILNPQTFSSKFLSDHEISILELFGDQKINVVELGGRTALTTKDFISTLHDLGQLGSYVDVDVSNDMIKLNRSNIEKWFNDDISYVASQKDVTRDRFDDVLISCADDISRNLVMLLGGTLSSFNDKKFALLNIRQSLMSNDYFMLSTKLDSEASRRYFDFNPSYQGELLPLKELFLIELLNIDKTFYDVEQFYDEQERQRRIQVRLKFDVTVKFKLEQGTKSIDFKKNETILLWRFWHQTMEEIIQEFNECGFNVMQAFKSPDEQYAMIIAKVKADKVNHR